MAARSYRLGRRQAVADRTRRTILVAASELLAQHPLHALSVGAVAARAGVSRITVYNQFGSRAGLLEAVARAAAPGVAAGPELEPREELGRRIREACARWSSEPALHRNLASAAGGIDSARDRRLAERLAGGDHLRPGCSIKEAEDVIGALTSFAMFDRLYKDGRRSPAAVVEILSRLAASILG